MLKHTVIVLAALAAALAGSPAKGAAAGESAIVVYVGTYTRGESRGIYRFALDPVSGEASVPVLAAASENPSFLALHPGGRFLYAVNETDDFGGEKTGSRVSARRRRSRSRRTAGSSTARIAGTTLWRSSPWSGPRAD